MGMEIIAAPVMTRQWRPRPQTVDSCHAAAMLARIRVRSRPRSPSPHLTMAKSPQHRPAARHVSLVALPDASASTLFGIHDVLSSAGLMLLGDTLSVVK